MNDLRYAVRMLLKNPGFTTVVLLTLALGIGASTAIFSVVNAVLLKPLPYRESDRLVTVCESNPRLGWEQSATSLGAFFDWREQSDAFEGLAAIAGGGKGALTGEQNPEMPASAFVSANFFPLLGIKPVLGRVFVEAEDQKERSDVVLISEKLWRQRFHADPEIINKSITYSGKSFAVVGVLPASFKFFNPAGITGWPNGTWQADIWRPLTVWPDALKWRAMRGFLVIGRLKPGITLGQAQSQMATIAGRLEKQYPDSNRGWGAMVRPWREQVTSHSRTTLLILLGAVGFVLLIACANVANLFLARSASRQEEFSIRAALGAGRKRVVRQLLTESLLLAMTGGILGVILAWWSLAGLKVFIPASFAQIETIRLDARVLGFSLLLSLATGMVFGLAPAWRAAQTDLAGALKAGGRGGGESFARNRTRAALVVAEIALALMLSVGAGLMMRSLWRLNAVDPGFKPEHLLALDIAPGGPKYAKEYAVLNFARQVEQRVASLPGVQTAATVHGLPFGDMLDANIAVTIAGRPASMPGEKLVAGLRQVSPGYFQTLGIPLIAGRVFSEDDGTNSPPVTIVNEAFARKYFGGENPVGRLISSPDFERNPCAVVGVVRNVKLTALDAPAQPEVYRPHWQSAWSEFSLVVRGTMGMEALTSAIRKEVRAVDKDMPVYNIRSLESQVRNSAAPRRFTLWLIGGFASLALFLAMIGIYGVMAYSVSRRTREFGIRLALGAQEWEVMRQVLAQGMILAILGASIGLAGSLTLTRLLASQLYGVTATDPLAFFAGAAALFAMAMAGCYVPARRAAKVDPMTTLKHE